MNTCKNCDKITMMKREEFEKIFNTVKDKNLARTTLTRPNNAEELSFVEAVNSADNNIVSEGASKACSYFGDKNQYVMLKHKNYVVKKANGQFKDTDVVDFNNWLISRGINIPKLYTIFFADHHYHEVYDRINGQEIYIMGYSHLYKMALGYDPIERRSLTMTDVELNKVASYLYDYNLSSQKIMLKYDVKQFSDLFQQYQFLWDIGFRHLDTHCGNLMITKQGFRIIDLDIKKNLTRIQSELYQLEHKKYTVPQLISRLDNNPQLPVFKSDCDPREFHSNLVSDYLHPFTCSNFHNYLLTDNQRKTIVLNSTKILAKAVNALTLNNMIVPTSEDGCNHIILNAVNGDIGRYKQVMQSQAKLKNSMEN